ncbi:MAG: phosphate signaling complex protein PhoU [Planctomycetota bacterium]
MTTHLRKDLESLERNLLYLAAQVEQAVRRSLEALLSRRGDLAKAVIEGDREIDRREVELEEECLKILALHQPVATDLRFVTACLKINNDLERVGDLACNIAERARSLNSMRLLPISSRLKDMMELTADMLRDALDAFVRSDADAAREICDRDDLVDRLNREMIEKLLVVMHEETDQVDQAMELISVSKNLERIADHATNIGEDVVYMVEGAIIRHRGAEDRSDGGLRRVSD